MAEEEDLDSDKSQSQATSSSTDPSLSRNLSLSKLNAQAPAFVPTRNPASRSDPPPHQQPQQQRLAIAPPPMGQAYPPAAAASPTHPPPPPPFHVPVHGPVRVPTLPIQDHHSQHHNNQRSHHRHQNHYHHHSQHHQYVPVHYPGQDQYHGGGVGEQEVEISTKKGHQATQAQGEQNHGGPPSKNGVSEEAAQKILNQVEYYFSDLNLATTDHLMRCISKDPEGYVPISVVASFKKIKALVNSNSQLATVLRTSPKLVVSEDGKKVRRQHLLTESDMEELQSRIVLAENLPEDHCHQNLMKIFSSIGSVKTIRTCQPQASSGGTSSASRSAKADGMHYSNKLHAFVEYESVELAEKAVAELNDEGNWRSGLRVCLMLKRTTKSAQARGKKVNDGEGHYEEEDTSTSDLRTNDKQAGDSSQQFDVHSHDHAGEGHVNEKDGVPKKGRNRGQGKGRGRTQYQQNNRGHHIGTPPSNNMVFNEQQMAVKQPPGPRMPDGTRGFAMGRGKPVAVNTE